MTTFDKVLAETMEAYCDCNEDLDSVGYHGRRNLHFRASSPVTRDEAVTIMRKAIPNGYNEFSADVLQTLPDDAMVTIAREGSVCVYVRTKFSFCMRSCDELDTQKDGTVRIWWD